MKSLTVRVLAAIFSLMINGALPPVVAQQSPDEDILQKKVTLRLDHVSRAQVLSHLQQKTGCTFVYSSTFFKSDKKLSVSYNNLPLSQVLTELLKDELSSIQTTGNRILLINSTGLIKGLVLDENGDPLPYVSIRVEGSKNGTVSAEDGTFSMKASSASRLILTASAVGYKSKSTSVNTKPGEDTQVSITLAQSANQMDEVTITADRSVVSTALLSGIAVKDLPMPVLIIEGKQIGIMGSRRLNEVLQEQTGLAMTTDPSGASNAQGLQVQGFDAGYTMIMIDGQPLIGRNSVGILDLSRITIANIDRIEVIKGTSSAIYGSDALAGVVNIITKKQVFDGITGVSALRYGTYNTLDATLDGGISLLKNNASAFLSTNFYRTDGFDADKATPGKTLPPFNSYAMQGKFNYRMSGHSILNTSFRYAGRDQRNRYDLDQLGTRQDSNKENDINTAVVLQHMLNEKTDIQTQYYFTRYKAVSSAKLLESGQIANQNEFTQQFHRLESFMNRSFSSSLKFTGGLGGNIESLDAQRYGQRRSMQNGFGYVQADYTHKKKFGLLTGMRYDIHSIYGSQLSPRFGLRYTVNKWLILKGTAGTGFKAPNFQQLYLSFTNPSAGYTVLGAAVFKEESARLLETGEITGLYPIASQVGDLKAERSASFNAGMMWLPSASVTLEVSAFHNNIRNMIFEELVGVKSNGSQVYSYRNIDQAYTRGLEANFKWKILAGLEVSAGYQLLYAKDKGIEKQIRAGELQVRTKEGRARTAVGSDYYNLTSRSRHMTNLKVFYELKKPGISLSIRANYRGKYGIGDRNWPNGFIDPYDLYAKGYLLLNATVEKRLFQNKLGIQLICDNMTGYREALIPNLPGRQFTTALSWKFGK